MQGLWKDLADMITRLNDLKVVLKISPQDEAHQPKLILSLHRNPSLMYWEIPQGSVLNVQGLDCYIPPAGYVMNAMVTGDLEISGHLPAFRPTRRTILGAHSYAGHGT
jgi:hypothetical protein